MLRHFVTSRWLHPLAPLKRLSPVDSPSANGFDKPFAASKFVEKHKIILRMIVTIRRINCFTDTSLCGIFVFIVGRDFLKESPRHFVALSPLTRGA